MLSCDKNLDWLVGEIRRMARLSQASAEIRAVLVHDGERWRNYATRVEMPCLFPERRSSEPEPQVFSTLALLRKVVGLNEIGSIEALQSQLSDWPEVGATWEIDLQPSVHATLYGGRNRYFSSPVWVFHLYNRRESSKLSFGHGPFLDPSLPVYRSVSHAAAEWLRDRYIQNGQGRPYQYQCVLMASRATIGDLQLEDGVLLIRIESTDQVEDLCCRIVARDREGRETQDGTKLAEQMRFQVPSDVHELEVYLIDGRGHPHDHFEETQQRCSWPTSVLGVARRARGERGWLEDVRKGEGVGVEFKQWLPTRADAGKRWELHETVVALANTKGGVIYIGVDNHGALRGIDHELRKQYGRDAKGDIEAMCGAYEKDLRLTITQEIEPDVQVEFERLSCGHQTVLAIHVLKGEETPYSFVHNKDIYIRRGANNMRPDRRELAQLMQSRSR